VRRAILFAVLGPPLGAVVGFWLIVPAMNWALSDAGSPYVWPGPDYHDVVLLPLAYSLGVIPAFLCGAFDEWLVRQRVSAHAARTAAFGFFACFLMLLPLFAIGVAGHPVVFIFGLVGAMPAAICAWISSWLWPLRDA
jgi:hypothetical protein